jgi:peroxiredoxin
MELFDSILEDAVLNEGDKVRTQTLTTIGGIDIALPAADRLVHLQFRRFAGCPICNLHMHQVASRLGDITAAGVTEVVLFHSSAQRLRRYQADLPFAVVADPKRALYEEFGVQNSVRGVLNRDVALAVGRGMRQMRSARSLVASLGPTENHLSMPADFLIAPDGVVLARKYGEHADDQWSVDDLLELAAER